MLALIKEWYSAVALPLHQTQHLLHYERYI